MADPFSDWGVFGQGVEPLQSLEALSAPQTSTSPEVAPVPSTSPQAARTNAPLAGDNGPLREFLAQALIGLGEGTGHKAPAFLTAELADRLKDRRRQALEERKGQRARMAGDLLSQGFQAELQGDDATAAQHYQQVLQTSEDPQVSKEAAGYLNAISKRKRGVSAEERARELQFRTGAKAMTAETITELASQFNAMGLPPAVQTKLLGQVLPEVRTNGKFTEIRDGRGNIIRRIPTEDVIQNGHRLITMSGTDVTQIHTLPNDVTLGKGQRVERIPGDITPGPGAPNPTGQTPSPSPGSIVPVGSGIQPTGPGVSQSLIPAETTGPEVTSEQAPFLTKRGISPKLSWDEIKQQYPNAAEVYLRDREQEKTAQIVANVSAQHRELARMPFTLAYPQSGKVMYNKASRMRDDTLTLNDVAQGKGVALDATTSRDVSQLSGILASVNRLEKIMPVVLASSPGANLGQALAIAVQRGLASNEDVATFDAVSGPLKIQVAALVNRGRPSDKDAEAVASSFPTSRDTIATGHARLKALKRMLTGSVDGFLGNNTTPLTDKELNLGDSVPGTMKPGGGTTENRRLPRTR